MSSATSTEPPTHAASRLKDPMEVADSPVKDSALRPWQFFVLAGMLCATAVVIVATGQSPASIIILSLTVLAASLVALGAYTALVPLVQPEHRESTVLLGGRTREALEREKTLVLRSIKELEFDFAMGKIAKADFEDMGGRLRARAIGLMRQLDAAEGYRGVIEHEVQARVSAKAAAAKSRSTQIPEQAVATESVTSDEIADVQPVCASCGEANDVDARFCKHCGHQLSAE